MNLWQNMLDTNWVTMGRTGSLILLDAFTFSQFILHLGELPGAQFEGTSTIIGQRTHKHVNLVI